MGDGQIIGVELFNHRLLCPLWEANEQCSGEGLYCELKVFNRLCFVLKACKKRFVDKFRLLYLPDILF